MVLMLMEALSASRIRRTCDHLIECRGLALEADQRGENAIEGGQEERQQEDDRQGPPREARMSRIISWRIYLSTSLSFLRHQKYTLAWAVAYAPTSTATYHQRGICL